MSIYFRIPIFCAYDGCLVFFDNEDPVVLQIVRKFKCSYMSILPFIFSFLLLFFIYPL